MPQKPTTATLNNEYADIFRFHTCIVTNEMEVQKQMWKSILEQLSIRSSRKYCFLNLNTGKLESCQTLIHHSVIQPEAEPETMDIEKINGYYPSKDVYRNTETDTIFYNSLMALPIELRKYFTLTCLRRIKNSHGKQNIYLLSAFVAVSDALGEPWLILIEFDLLAEFKAINFSFFRQYELNKIKMSKKYTVFEKYNINNLTEQEKKVLKLVNEKPSIREMAEEFSVTQDTIRSHRYQAMKKLNAPSLHLASFLARVLKII